LATAAASWLTVNIKWLSLGNQQFKGICLCDSRQHCRPGKAREKGEGNSRKVQKKMLMAGVDSSSSSSSGCVRLQCQYNLATVQ